MSYRELELRTLLDVLIRRIETTPFTSDGLSYGKTGGVLLYAYYGKLTGEERYTQYAMELIQDIFTGFNTSPYSITSTEYYSGLTGFLWVLDHLHRHEFIDLSDVELDYMDAIVFDWTIAKMKDKDFDFFSGAGGGFNYLIRKPDWISTGAKQLVKITETIVTGKVYHNDTGFYVNEEYNRNEGFTQSTVNYGLPHGVGSVISYFDHVLTNKSTSTTARKEIQSIVSSYGSISDTLFNKSKYNVYPNYLDPLSKKYLTQKRLGWCHSDFNQLQYDLTAYSHGLSNNSQEQLELHFKKIITRNTYELNLLDDPFVCHGFGGAMVYTQHLQHSLPKVPTSAFMEYCTDELLRSYKSILDKSDSEVTSSQYHIHSLFYGDVGTALTLISTLRPELRTWSEIILL